MIKRTCTMSVMQELGDGVLQSIATKSISIMRPR